MYWASTAASNSAISMFWLYWHSNLVQNFSSTSAATKAFTNSLRQYFSEGLLEVANSAMVKEKTCRYLSNEMWNEGYRLSEQLDGVKEQCRNRLCSSLPVRNRYNQPTAIGCCSLRFFITSLHGLLWLQSTITGSFPPALRSFCSWNILVW